MKLSSPIPHKTLYRAWIDPSLKPSPQLPFTVKLTLLGPTVELNLNSIKNDLIFVWNELRGEKPNPDKILTVEQCAGRIRNNELEEGDEVCVGAICDRIIPSRIIVNPGLSAWEKNVGIVVGEGAGAFSPRVGMEFFNGIPCNYIYLVQVNWQTSSYLRVYFQATEVGEEFLVLLNNLSVVVVGKLDKTPSPYPCKREGKLVDKTVVDELTDEISLAIRATALFLIQQPNLSESIKYYKKEEYQKTRFTIASDRGLELYWLRGNP